MALSWTLDKLGPLARGAEDCALVLAAIAGPDPADPTTGETFRHRERAPRRGRPGRRFRVGVLRHAAAGAEPEVEARFAEALSVLRDVADLDEDVAFPELPYREAVSLIVAAEGASALREIVESGKVRQLRDPADRLGGYAIMATRAADYIDAMRARVRMRQELDALLARYDAVVAPTRGGVAPPIGRDFDAATPGAPVADAAAPRPPATIPAGNLAGLPALAAPMGFGRDGLPVSLQLLGRAFSEETLVAIASAYQEMTDWHRRRPPGV
jgi:aspartyl-tRNA(Asn)/glutamyl-tRNA(Gln) amidotransferase subunit A